MANIKNRVIIFIVEDDAIQREILKDKLIDNNSNYQVISFENGESLFNYLKNNKLYTNSYLILDYFLQNNNNPDAINGNEVIEVLKEHYPNLKTILFSAYDNDENNEFISLKHQGKVIDFVKKTEHAYSYLINTIRLDNSKTQLYYKQKRLKISITIFIVIFILSVLFMCF